MKNKAIMFLDLDGVLATSAQFDMKNRHPKYDCYPFDNKCIKVFNEILRETDPIIILTSDWKYHYNQVMMNNIFRWNEIIKPISDFTSSLWGTKFKSVNDLEQCRAQEILEFLDEHDFTNNKWVAIDDLDLSPYLPDENFIHTPRVNEGIKQTGIKEKIIKQLL